MHGMVHLLVILTCGCGFETFFGFAPTFEWSLILVDFREQITILNTQGGIVVDLIYDDWAGGLGDGDGYSIVGVMLLQI